MYLGLGLILGGALIRILCLSLEDIKVLIAYSSVAHMRVVVGGILVPFSSRFAGAGGMMVTHGFASSSLFLISYYIYLRSSTRNIILHGNGMGFTPSLGYLWFVRLAIRMATPPSGGFFREVLSGAGLLVLRGSVGLPYAVIVLCGGLYRIILFRIRQYGGRRDRGKLRIDKIELYCSSVGHVI